MSKGNDDEPDIPALSLTGMTHMDNGFDKRGVYKFVVRLPWEMRDRIAEASNNHRRSMNSEIVSRIEQTFSGLPSEAAMVMIEPPLQGPLDALFRRSLTDEEHTLVKGFRRLSAGKRQALIDLLK